MLPLALGIDVGTGGVRALAVAPDGAIAGAASTPLGGVRSAAGMHEQDPTAWVSAVDRVLHALWEKGVAPHAVRAVSVDGTSGTLVCTDTGGRPVRPALLYDDARAEREAYMLCEIADGAKRITSSFSIAKALWVREHEPDVYANAAHLIHPADYIAGSLSGIFGVSDYSNSLKMGYDPECEAWPDWLGHWPDLRARLPAVVPPGAQTGGVTAVAAARTGLPERIPVIAGATDGVASAIASGALGAGAYNTTLGTTLVFKGFARAPYADSDGRMYSHRLPGGLWLPGAASNTGAGWIRVWFPGADPAALDQAASGLLPSAHIAYPLARQGERFPFHHSKATGFIEPPTDGIDRYAACLQGTAFVERMGYEVLDAALGSASGAVYSTGGGSRSDLWMQVRADVCQRVFHRPACPEAAFGAAVLAASTTVWGSLQEAMEHMARPVRTFAPQPGDAYEAAYARFLGALRERAYL